MNREKLEKIIPFIAEKYNFRFETIEKDFYLTLLLNSVESHLGGKIVFKGGTLLNKIHLNYHRLSEDLDFTYLSDVDLESRPQRSRAIAPIKEKIKLEISLRQAPFDKPVHNLITHFYKDPFTGEDLIPRNKILSLTLKEAVAEKLKAAITRKDVAIRDYYDLWFISQTKFDFKDKHFFSLFKKKLEADGYKSEYAHNFGLDQKSIELLYRQIGTELLPVIRVGENFDLDKVFDRFNVILG